MSEYPKVLHLPGVNVTVQSAEDEDRWLTADPPPPSPDEPAPVPLIAPMVEMAAKPTRVRR